MDRDKIANLFRNWNGPAGQEAPQALFENVKCLKTKTVLNGSIEHIILVE